MFKSGSAPDSGKRRLPALVVAIPALTFLLVFFILPALAGVSMSFFTGNGIKSAQWAGLENYITLFSAVPGETSSYALRLTKNIVCLSVFPALATAGFAFLLTCCISALPRRWCRKLALCVLAFPALAPSTYFAGLVIELTASDGLVTLLTCKLGLIDSPRNLLSLTACYPWVYTAAEVLRFGFYPVLLGVLACERQPGNALDAAGKTALAYLVCRCCLASCPLDGQLGLLLYNPLVYPTADNFFALSYRRGFQEACLGYGAMLDTLRLLGTAALAVPGFFVLRRLTKQRPAADAALTKCRRPVPVLLALFGALILLSGVFILFWQIGEILVVFFGDLKAAGMSISDVFSLLAANGNVRGFVNSLLYSLSAGALSVVLALLLAYPMGRAKRCYSFLLLLALFGSTVMAARFLELRLLGLADSFCGGFIYGSCGILGAFALRRYVDGHPAQGKGFGSYLKAALPAVVVIACAGFILCWSGGGDALMTLISKARYPSWVYIRWSMVESDVAVSFCYTSKYGYMSAVGFQTFGCLLSSLPPFIAGCGVICLDRRLPAELLCAGIKA